MFSSSKFWTLVNSFDAVTMFNQWRLFQNETCHNFPKYRHIHFSRQHILTVVYESKVAQLGKPLFVTAILMGLFSNIGFVYNFKQTQTDLPFSHDLLLHFTD